MRGTEERPIPRGYSTRGFLGRTVTLVDENIFIILALAACGILQTIVVRGAIKPDSWYTLVAGRLIARSGLPHHDTLTAIAHGRVWVDQQWLGQLGGYALWRAGGWPLALAASGACFLAAFAVAATAARLGGATERSTVLVLLACLALGLPNAVFRTQIPAYLLCALVLLLLLRDERRPSRGVYLVFPLLIIWANLHGSVVVGAGLVALRGGVFAVSKLREHATVGGWLPRAVTLLVVPWACVFASPYANDLPRYYRKLLWNPTYSHVVSEWAPSTLRSQPVFIVLFLAALWLTARSRGSLGPFAQLALLTTGIGGLFAVRNIVWFGLVAAAVVPFALDGIWRPAQAAQRHRNINLALAFGGAAALMLVVATTASRSRSWFENHYPRAVAQAVGAEARRDPQLKVFASGFYADWLLFEEPQLAGRVAFDTRFEILSDDELTRIADFVGQSGNNWRRAADSYDLFVLEKEADPPPSSIVGPKPDILAAEGGAIVVRRPGARTP